MPSAFEVRTAGPAYPEGSDVTGLLVLGAAVSSLDCGVIAQMYWLFWLDGSGASRLRFCRLGQSSLSCPPLRFGPSLSATSTSVRWSSDQLRVILASWPLCNRVRGKPVPLTSP